MIVEHAGSQSSPQPPSFEDVEEVKQKAREMIVEHPLTTVGGAFAIGAMIALLRGRRSSSKKSGAITGVLGGVVIALLRDAAIRRLSGYANHWIDQKTREEAASRQRETEAFMEH
jgi:hypothetical protein